MSKLKVLKSKCKSPDFRKLASFRIKLRSPIRAQSKKALSPMNKLRNHKSKDVVPAQKRRAKKRKSISQQKKEFYIQ